MSLYAVNHHPTLARLVLGYSFVGVTTPRFSPGVRSGFKLVLCVPGLAARSPPLWLSGGGHRTAGPCPAGNRNGLPGAVQDAKGTAPPFQTRPPAFGPLSAAPGSKKEKTGHSVKKRNVEG